MKNLKTLLLIVVTAIALSFTSCKKETTTPQSTPQETEVTKCYTCTETTEHHSWSVTSPGHENLVYENGATHLGPIISYKELQYCGTTDGMRAFENSHDNNYVNGASNYTGNESEIYCDCVENN